MLVEYWFKWTLTDLSEIWRKGITFSAILIVKPDVATYIHVDVCVTYVPTYNHNGLITHLEPDILQCKVKWALGSITMNKASGGDGIPVELFQILKDDAVKVLPSIWQQIWKTQHWPQDGKMSVFIPVPKKGNAKECSHYHTIALI